METAGEPRQGAQEAAKAAIVNIGRLAVELEPLRIQQVTHPMAHLIVARDFIAGLRAIQSSGQHPNRAIALLAGQAVESLFEGYVLASLAANERPRDWGHDLEKLWSAAVAKGLAVPKGPPSWLVTLAQGHRSPFPVRYQRTTEKNVKAFAHGSSYPPMQMLFDEVPRLEALMAPLIETYQQANG